MVLVGQQLKVVALVEVFQLVVHLVLGIQQLHLGN